MSKTVIFVTSSNIHMYFLFSSMSIYPFEMFERHWAFNKGPVCKVFFLDHLESYIKIFFPLPCLYLYRICDITFDFIIMLGIKPV